MIGLIGRLPGQLLLNRRLEFGGRNRFRRTDRFLFATQLGQIANGFIFTGEDNITAGFLIAVDPETAVIDTNKRDELFVVVLDEENVAFPDFEFRRVSHFHCFVAHGPAEQSNCVGSANLPFYVVFDLKGHVAIDVALSAFTFPDRTHVSDRALKDQFSLANQLLKCWRDYGRSINASESEGEYSEDKNVFCFHSM